MEQIRSIPAAEQYFSFARTMVGATDRPLMQRVESREVWDSWDSWVFQALEAVGQLHSNGLLHGFITPTALRVEDRLRLGSLQHVRKSGTMPPVDLFQPHALYTPPEQLLQNGLKQTIPFASMMHALKQENWPMDQIETFFPDSAYKQAVLYKVYERIQDPRAFLGMGEASDIWMLGISLLTVYSEMLQNSFAITSQFYQTRHEDFLDLVEAMVQADPNARPSWDALLKQWSPTEKPTEPFVSSVPSVPSEKTVETSETEFSEKPVEPFEKPVSSNPLKPRRPFLTLQSHSAGRSKTRRNPRS